MKSKDFAMASFILGLISWVPLLNFVIAPAALYFGIKAIRRIKKHPDKYTGMAYAVIGTIIGFLIMFFSYSWLFLRIIGKL